MQDKLLVAVAMIALLLFCDLVIVYVAEPDLIIITTLVLGMAVHDFWISVFRKPQPTAASVTSLEDRPVGASGKTLGSPAHDFEPAGKGKPGKKK